MNNIDMTLNCPHCNETYWNGGALHDWEVDIMRTSHDSGCSAREKFKRPEPDDVMYPAWSFAPVGSWTLEDDDPRPYGKPRRRSATELGLRAPDRTRATVYAGEILERQSNGRYTLWMDGGRRV
ncbi:hypothetical protein ACQR3W_21750 [Rhodococcus ruber]|uniref:Uncharacterized protein n=1 Tax=Rhodococcus ruber TaxID=1830 RepID=A0A098BLA0_9NOCA|nr:hypothetical protein [Rhodococcus ruber]MCZ4533360.1 hypothetical protein [Rhodococcus ruber]MCZ4533389.1 hypothetical protein [Rhodococcus ruber]CDZ88982.1 hypothetical protein RHRU231_450149 [Rhodococcus ruber]